MCLINNFVVKLLIKQLFLYQTNTIMLKTIKCVLFIDDDKATNYINQFLAKKSNYFENIIVASSAEEGLEYLEQAEKGISIIPEIIFLDINMPAMNGWDFLNSFKLTAHQIKNNIKIYMLTSSSREQDINKAKEFNVVKGFVTKPLTKDVLEKISLS